MAEIKFEIKQTVGVLSESAKGWKKELNLISWNDKQLEACISNMLLTAGVLMEKGYL